mmetsp:Transcript_6232/g.14270  ORF Transcript_6232/g.14270 Transcript_6232/m.14270 type:complete len:142 (-) Transcript_6232:107-532(-)
MFEVSMVSAFLVTSVTYTVLVPGALFVEQPSSRRGAVEILLSPQGHVMHSLNTVFILTDFAVSRCKRQVFMQDVIFGILWSFSFAVFEWVFHSRTGLWHYPFMDYNRPTAELAYIGLAAVFFGFWRLAALVTAPASEGKFS